MSKQVVRISGLGNVKGSRSRRILTNWDGHLAAHHVSKPLGAREILWDLTHVLHIVTLVVQCSHQSRDEIRDSASAGAKRLRRKEDPGSDIVSQCGHKRT